MFISQASLTMCVCVNILQWSGVAVEERGNSRIDRKCVFLEEWTPYCNQLFLTHV